MSHKPTKNGEQASQCECPKDQFLLSVTTGLNQHVFLYQVKGFYVEFITNAAQMGRATKKKHHKHPNLYQSAERIAAPANYRHITISLDGMDLQRFSIYMN